MSITVSSGVMRGGGGTGTILVTRWLVPCTSLPNLRLCVASTLIDALQQANPTLALTPTLMLVSLDEVVLMSMVTSIVASENW